MSNRVIDWTDERIDLVTRRWLDGVSAMHIARELGGVVTRNAVIAKVHRLGLTRNHPAPPPPVKITKPKPPRVVAEKPTEPPAPKVTKSARGVTIRIPEPVIATPVCEVVKIEFVGRRSCKWPSGDPRFEGFSFCGDPVHVGVDAAGQDRVWSYCLPHCRAAYPLFGKKADRRPTARERREAARYI